MTAVLSAKDVTIRTRSGQTLLAGAAIEVHPGELVAITGPSGAGKTTLLRALAGRVLPTSGDRTVAPDPWSVGFVPQDDIVHTELTVVETVRYAARLRADASTAPAAIDNAVDHTIRALGLSARADVKVGALSGGQRKRVSIATELVTRPAACLLDEPTSGLDPVAAAELIDTLRDLADRGTAVVFTTHNLADLVAADRLIVVESGGRISYDGPPSDAPHQYRTVRRNVERRPLRSGTKVQRIPMGRPSLPQRVSVLTSRNFAVLARNRLSAAIMAGSPIAVVAMLSILFRRGAGARDPMNPDVVNALAYWLAFAGFFFGLTFGLLQVCTELPIVQREAHVGVGVGAYLASKVILLVPMLVFVNLIMVGTLAAFERLADLSTTELLMLQAALCVDSMAGLAIGLAASAAVTSATQATLALPMLCFPAVLFGGAIVAVDNMTRPGQVIAAVTSTRWSFDAVVAILAGDGREILRPCIAVLVIGCAAAASARTILRRRLGQ